MRERMFYSTCFGFIAGVFVASFLDINLYFIILLSVIGLTLFLLLRRTLAGIIFGLGIIALSLGLFYPSLFSTSPPGAFERMVAEDMDLVGLIVDEPDMREGNQKLEVLITNQSLETKILLTTDFSQRFSYGDEIRFSSSLEKPENFITDQGKEFDYINYLRKDGIYYLAYYPEIEIISSGNGSALRRVLFSVKDKFLNNLDFQIDAPESTLLGGLILGERSAFSQELRQDFIDTGTIHIVALSGYNVTIIAEWIIKALGFLPFLWGIISGIFAIILFVLMTGAPATAVRAGLMAVLALVARATGRTYEVARALVLAGVAMVLINPLVLRYDVSFQLSFMATVAVIFFAPKVEKYFLWVTPRWGLRDVVAVTTSAYLFVLPFILYQMGNLSLVALPANILILPLIPLTMIFGFATGVFGFIWHGLAEPFALAGKILLSYELKVVDILANFSFSSFTIPNFPLVLTIAIYIFLFYKLFGRNIKAFFNPQHRLAIPED